MLQSELLKSLISHVDLLVSLVVNKSTSTQVASQPRLRRSRAMRSCVAARTLVLPASSGVHFIIDQQDSYAHTSPRDPRFIREFKAKYCVEVFAEHLPTKKKYVY